MATCFLKQKTSTFTWKRYENFAEGLTPRQEPGVEQADQPGDLSFSGPFLAATHVGNYALFGGGYNFSDHYYNVVDAYNASLEKSTPTPLSQARDALAATHVGNYALFGGGYGISGYSNVVDAYNTSLEKSAPTPLSQARYNLAATHIGNYALFGGGYTDGGGGDRDTNTVDAYQENQELCDFPVIPNSIYKFEPYDSEATASDFSKVTVNYPVNGYVKYISTTLN